MPSHEHKVWSDDPEKERKEWEEFHRMRDEHEAWSVENEARLTARAKELGVLDKLEEYRSRFWRNLDVPLFGSAEVASLAQITPSQVKNWVDRNFVVPQGDFHTGRGRKRQYTTRDAVTFAMMGRMTDCGVGLDFFGSKPGFLMAVNRRASDLATEPEYRYSQEEGALIVVFKEAGFWAVKPFNVSMDPTELTSSLLAYSLIRFDAVIEETFDRIEALKPGFTINRKGGDLHSAVFADLEDDDGEGDR